MQDEPEEDGRRRPASRAARVRAFLRERAGAVQAALFGLALAAIGATALAAYRAIERELTEVALARRAALARLAAATVAERFARLLDLSASLATRVRFRDLVAKGEWLDAVAILGDVPRDFPFVERLFLTDVEGTLRADIPEVPGARGLNLAEHEWYRGVRAGSRPYLSPVYVRWVSPRIEVFAVAAPIRAPAGELAGFLVLHFPSEWLREWLAEIDLGPEGFAYIVDSAGQVAAHSKFPAAAQTLDYGMAPAVQKLRRGERGVEVGFDPFERVESVWAYAPVEGFGWGVVVQQSARAAFAARDLQLRNVVVASALILAFLLLALDLARRLMLERRRAAEEQRRRAELERRVAERTAQLEAANRELESFSYSVSHDLRAPLRAVDGFARMLEEDYGARLDEEGRRRLAVVRDSAQRMGRLIDGLLKFSRLGRAPLAASALDMAALVRGALEELGAAAAEPRVTIEIGALPAASGDPVLLRQVWLNLLENAVKFSARRDFPRIEVGGRGEEAQAVYWVRDNGAGFDMRYSDKLFGVFQRLHDPGEYPGTGIGLATVQRIVARHGGRVWAEGEPDKGATFYFSLPRGGGP